MTNAFTSNPTFLNSLFQTIGQAQDERDAEDKQKANVQAYRKYMNYLGGIANNMQAALEGRADKYDTKLQDQFNSAEPEFQQEADNQLPELQKLMDDIAQQSTETQQGDLRRINAILAQQGVRGGQAAILANRAMGETSRDTLRQLNQLAYDDAAKRQDARLNYYSQKALTPWTNMSSAYNNSMVGANNALSKAQGDTYTNAYSNMMTNYMNAQAKKNKKGGLGSKLGGVFGTAIGSVYGGPVGGAVGNTVGSAAGGYLDKKM